MVGDAVRALDVGPVALDAGRGSWARPGRPAGRAGRQPRSRRRGRRRGGTAASAARPRRRRPAGGTRAGRTRRCSAGRLLPSRGPGRAGPRGTAPGRPSSSTSAAAARYFSMRIGGTNRVEALLSNPAPPPPSAGKASAGWVSTPSRSRIVLLYCRRVSRWIRLGRGRGHPRSRRGWPGSSPPRAGDRPRSGRPGCPAAASSARPGRQRP